MSSDPTASPPPAAPATPDGAIDWSPFSRIAVVVALVGVALFAIGAVAGHAPKGRMAGALLTGYTFWLSLPIGGMALLLIGYLVKSSWARLLRRFFEAATRTWPLLFVLFLVLGALTASHDYSPYWWTHPHETPVEPLSANPAADAEPGNKRDLAEKYGHYMIAKAVEHEREGRDKGNFGFLTTGSFFGVGVVLWGIWATFIVLLNKWGREATGSRAQVDEALRKANYFSGPALIVYAITITAGATQWVMSLEPGWSSTMFPVIFAVNQFLTCFALSLSLFLLIVSRPPVKALMRPKFQIDMGTLLLAFTLFWTYTSFSQFMLVWIGNLPEEIPFYLKRSMPTYGGWWWVSAGLAALHFALPFLLLLFRDIKMHPKRLRAVAMFLVCMCMVDVVWWIAPAFQQEGTFPTWIMDVGALLGVGGVWALYFFTELKKRPIMATDEAYLLPEGHHHEHH